MPSLRRVGWLSVLAVLLATGCTIAPPPGSPIPPAAELRPGGGRVFVYGHTVDEVLQNREVASKVRDLFGADWASASQSGGQLALGAGAYFRGKRTLRIGRLRGRH